MELKNIIHLYMGCEVYDHFNDVTLTLTPKAFAGYMEHWERPEDGQIKPILRPLSSWTEEEKRIDYDVFAKFPMQYYQSQKERILLSKGFDLFGLIESGKAIDKSTLP